MRIQALLLTDKPRTGAFVTTWELLDRLTALGHEVIVVLPTERPVQADWTITHLGDPRASRVQGNHLLLCHGANRRYKYRLPGYTRCWFPSEALKQYYGDPPGSVVSPPPVNPERYRTTRGDHVTLASAIQAKGLPVFRRLALRLSDLPFLAVGGPRWHDAPTNVTLVPRFDDPRELYSRSRVMIMPSLHEAYGRVAVEAAVSGIPTVASDLPGIREAMGDAATYIGPVDWAAVVPAVYDSPEASRRAAERGSEIDYEADLQAMLDLLC